MVKKIIIDTDPAMGTKGGDPEDCFAIMMALNSPELEVLGITAVQGNVPVERGYSNAHYLINHFKRDIPIRSGPSNAFDDLRNKDRIWLSQREEMEQIAPIVSKPTDEEDAADFIYKTATEHSGELELITIGPLTNIAIALQRYKDFNNHIKKITMMAGAAKTPGNITPSAEFNVWADPEAADEVFQSGIPLIMIPLDVCHQTRMSRDELIDIGKNDHPFCQFVKESVDPWINIRSDLISDAGLHLYDSLAMASLIDDDILSYKQAFVRTETSGSLTSGETVCEFNESILGQIMKPKPNTEVALELDVEGFNKIFQHRVVDYLKKL
jgi:inosine-uridine nucleoside N-ribohydrolase